MPRHVDSSRMYGNEKTNEVLHIDHDGRTYYVTQLRGPNDESSKGHIFYTTSNRALKAWWDEYSAKSPHWKKLVRHTEIGQPIETELTDTVQPIGNTGPEPAPYTHTSGG